MRLVRLSVPTAQRDEILATLREQNLEYTLTQGAGDQADRTNVEFLVPADAVEHVLGDLEAAGYDRTMFSYSVSTEFATFEDIDGVQEHWANTPNQIAPATLRSKAKDMRSNTRSYFWLMTLSTVIATAGLLLSSPAVVVGSMVIAPVVGPMLTASIGAVRDDRDMVVGSAQQQTVGLGVAFLGAVLFSLLVKYGFAVPRTLAITSLELVALRLSPSLLAIAVGFASGAAGAYGLATKGQVSIVGVMIAAALIPSAAAAGIGVAWGELVLGVGALALLIVTVAAVNLGAFLMFRYLGYTPDDVDEGLFTLPDGKRAAVVVLTALLVFATVAVVGVGSYQQVRFDRSVNAVTTEVLNEERYQRLGIRGISTEYVGVGSGIGGENGPVNVTLTLRRETDRPYAELPSVIDQRLTRRTDRPIGVSIHFVDYRTSNVSVSGENRSRRRADAGTVPTPVMRDG